MSVSIDEQRLDAFPHEDVVVGEEDGDAVPVHRPPLGRGSAARRKGEDPPPLGGASTPPTSAARTLSSPDLALDPGALPAPDRGRNPFRLRS